MYSSKHITVPVLLAVSLTGCSSAFTSKQGPGNSGLNYYLPKKDLRVTVTVEDDKPISVLIDTTEAYPQLDQSFVLQHNANWVSKHQSDVTVTSAGLLSKADAIQTGQTVRLAQAIGSAAAALADEVSGAKGADQKTCPAGVHSKTWDIAEELKGLTGEIELPGGPCDMTVKIKRLSETGTPGKENGPTQTDEESGVYYRQNIPYRVEVDVSNGTDPNAFKRIVSKVVLSPSESKPFFLPSAEGFFANSESKFSFSNGVPTQFNTISDGEIIGALTLPAEVIKGYFSAVGALFDSFSNADQKESAALTNSLSLELQKLKYEACIEAVKQKDSELITQLNCG